MLRFGFSVSDQQIQFALQYNEQMLNLEEGLRSVVHRSSTDDKGLSEFAYLFNGIRIRYAKWDVGQLTELKMHNEQAFVQLRINLSGESLFSTDNKLQLTLKAQHCNLLFFPVGSQVVDRFPLNGDQEIFRIDLHTDLFLKYCPEGKSDFQFFREMVGSDKLAVLSENAIPLNAQMYTIIQEIMSCGKSELFRPVFLKIKVVELLLLQLEQFEQLQQLGKTYVGLKEAEWQRMQQVKEILDTQYELDHSLLSLARRVGTNDATLKKHFKLAFGTTVFTYLNEVRMLRAKTLLVEDKEKVAVVAAKVGYKHATHFSAAFKKYFGYLPTKVKFAWFSCLFDCGVLSEIDFAFASCI
ncbi:helix-turn-helix transcriptional regulator [Olivibacter sp. XZL3]|uniref:helix-turn-helix transcriptional regulator n=1 Tax=Olivibacter sp. XZL3 TaxID=1735116 RepID=UPI001064E176|nr:AraC family transcriptional regulator [Olivibacter sp. XZL3]